MPSNLQPSHQAAIYLARKNQGRKSHGTVVLALAQGDRKNIDLILGSYPRTSGPDSGAPSTAVQLKLWSFPINRISPLQELPTGLAVGGHGSDSALRTKARTSRAKLLPSNLTVRTALKSSPPDEASKENESNSKLRTALADSPGSFEANHQLGEFYLNDGRFRDSIPLLLAAYRINPAMDNNTYELALAYKEEGDFTSAREYVQKLRAHNNSADLHRLAGEIDEELGDPLAAIHEYKQAVSLDRSEQNYFAWGSELLLHRTLWQAVEVFQRGSQAIPKICLECWPGSEHVSFRGRSLR